MSLVIIKEPKPQSAETAGNLEPGTWFLDLEGEISAILIDERTYEKRVITAGLSFRPFIADRPARSVRVKAIIPVGTALQVSQCGISGGQENDG